MAKRRAGSLPRVMPDHRTASVALDVVEDRLRKPIRETRQRGHAMQLSAQLAVARRSLA